VYKGVLRLPITFHSNQLFMLYLQIIVILVKFTYFKLQIDLTNFLFVVVITSQVIFILILN